MEQHQDDSMIPKSIDQAQPANAAVCKKPYVSPVLIEYGTIAKLTQGTRTRKNDGGNTRQQKTCL